METIYIKTQDLGGGKALICAVLSGTDYEAEKAAFGKDNPFTYLPLANPSEPNAQATAFIAGFSGFCYLVASEAAVTELTTHYFTYVPATQTLQALVVSEAHKARLTLSALQESKKKQAKSYSQNERDPVLINGHTLKISASKRMQLYTALRAAERGGETTFQVVEGALVLPPLPITQLKNLLDTIEIKATKEYVIMHNHCRAIDALTTPEAVKEYDCTSGYLPLITLTL